MRADIASIPHRMLTELERVIAGQSESLELILATALSGGHVLLEDRPGVGKTVMARALGKVFGIEIGRIQGTPDLMPTDITGVHVFQPNTAEWTFRPGPVFARLLLVDELNRATPKAQSALLEAMAEGQVTVDGATFVVPTPFIVIATQNPLGEAGTHPLSFAQIDRFSTMVRLGLPGTAAEREVLLGQAGKANLNQISPVLSAEYVPQLIDFVRRIEVSESVVDYTLALINHIRSADREVWLSVRVSEMLLNVARGRAFVQQRNYVAPEDVQHVAPAVLAHRLPRSLDELVVTRAIEQLPVPAYAS